MQEPYQILLGLITGLGLAAACGFRVFVPLLVASLAIRGGVIEVASGFEWIGSLPATICFGSATLLEIGGYYLPGLDHFLDTVATPAAVVAGTLVTAAFLGEVDPWWRWSLAAIAGGSLAGVVQASTVAVRGASGLTTMGLANPVVATAELAGASTTAIAAFVAPLVVLIVLAVVFYAVYRWWRARARPVPVPG
jgi:hypothetical protein